ncbi:MAG TPA: sigma-70 family RNA polymerase sigma factor [Terriglobales bacterium]
MTATAAQMRRESASSSDDSKLIKRCLKGDQEAWGTLIDKYKNLIYSIPVKLGMYQDAGDIFQAVCVELLTGLPNIRDHRALPKWLIQTCYHKCLRYRHNAGRQVEIDPAAAEEQAGDEMPPEAVLVQLEQEQRVRGALAQISSRCQKMIRMLFFDVPPRPYDQIAKELGLATGSIGFIRGRCLAYLRKQLEKEELP